MKPIRLHHVGIIMTSLERAAQFMDQFGLEEDYREYVDAYQAWCIFTKYSADESPVEFVVPTAGKLTEFNKGKGGLHHIAFEVEDVNKAREEFTQKGMEMLEETPAKGAGGIIVNFLRPRYGLGVLVEFVERTDK